MSNCCSLSLFLSSSRRLTEEESIEDSKRLCSVFPVYVVKIFYFFGIDNVIRVVTILASVFRQASQKGMLFFSAAPNEALPWNTTRQKQ